MMEAAYTVNRETNEAEIMVTATFEEWEQILGNVDGIGHSPAMLDLIKELKSWGLRKRYGCC